MKKEFVFVFLPAMALAAIAAVAAIPPQQAQALGPQTKTISVAVDATIPVRGDTVDGQLTMTLSGYASDLAMDWSFRGEVNGASAAAAGRGTAFWTGQGYHGTLTNIDTWDVPIPQPILPKSTVVFSLGRVTFIGGFPFVTNRPLLPPFAQPSSYQLSTLWDLPGQLIPRGLRWPTFRLPLQLFQFNRRPTGSWIPFSMESASANDPLIRGSVSVSTPRGGRDALAYQIEVAGATPNAAYEVYVKLDGGSWERQAPERSGYFSLLVTNQRGDGAFRGAFGRTILSPGSHTLQFALRLAGYDRYQSDPIVVQVRR